MGIAMICLKRTIQGPGFGSQRVHTGTSVRMSQGRAMPRPSARNTAEAVTVLCVTAYPSAAPIKGAVQGDATTTASTPVQKFKGADEVHRNCGEKERQNGNYPRALQLKAPAHGAPHSPKHHQGAGQKEHAHQNARGKHRSVQRQRSFAAAAVHKLQNLEA